jgi:hypothetical protein
LPNIKNTRAIPPNIVQSAAQSATGLPTTILSAVNNIQNVIGTIETATSDIIEVLIPKNYFLNIKQFYIGFNNNINYFNLFLDISKIILIKITNIIGNEI